MPRLFLVRHAVHDLVGKVLAGRTPGLPLSQAGKLQAERLGAHFAGLTPGAILASPVQRAQETAAVIARNHGGGVETTEALTEIDCGVWTGRSFESLASDPSWAVWNAERAGAAIPGGETMEAVQQRVAGLLERLAGGRPDPVILISHADIIKAILALLIDMSLNLHDRLSIDPASITTVDLWGPRAGKIVRMNAVLDP